MAKQKRRVILELILQPDSDGRVPEGKDLARMIERRLMRQITLTGPAEHDIISSREPIISARAMDYDKVINGIYHSLQENPK
jgi:hypothetical protein